MQADWWRGFFEGPAAEFWHRAVPAAMTEAETGFLASVFAPGAALLDVPCGSGRIACALASRGYRVTGADLSATLLGWAETAGKGLDVQWHRLDMRDLPWTNAFDGACCVGNSFGYLGDDGDAAFLRAVHKTLRPGGTFVLEALTAEALFQGFVNRRWHDTGDLLVVSQSAYDPLLGELRIDYTFVRDGRREQATAFQRVRMAREVAVMLALAGFADVQVFGGHDKSALGLQGGQRALFVARA